jgi:peroxisomal 3,2-trans-enoyl-CoA isomerase
MQSILLPQRSTSILRTNTLLLRRPTSILGNNTLLLRRSFAASAKQEMEKKAPLVLRSDSKGVRTLTMNNPRRFNAWTQPMLEALFAEFTAAAEDEATKVVVLTGAGKYYCAGVDLAAILKPMHPQTLHDLIYQKNKLVFDAFLDFPKPIIAAVQGPAIGASVTTATLCDALVMSERATLSTPFARLSVPPEGCSSVHFPKVMGAANAQRMLGPDAWAPTAAEAKEAGLAHEVVVVNDGDGSAAAAAAAAAASHYEDGDEAATTESLDARVRERAQGIAEQWVADGRLHRSLPRMGGGGDDGMGAATAGAAAEAARAELERYKGVNDSESQELARQFLGPGFLQAQIDFMTSKGKTQPAAVFKAILASRPLWSMLLSDDADVVRYQQKNAPKSKL